MFLAAGIQPLIVARAFRRVTMAMLVHSGAGVTLLPGSFAGVAMDGVVMRPLSFDGHSMRVAAAYPEGNMEGIVAQFLRIASVTGDKAEACLAELRENGYPKAAIVGFVEPSSSALEPIVIELSDEPGAAIDSPRQTPGVLRPRAETQRRKEESHVESVL